MIAIWKSKKKLCYCTNRLKTPVVLQIKIFAITLTSVQMLKNCE